MSRPERAACRPNVADSQPTIAYGTHQTSRIVDPFDAWRTFVGGGLTILAHQRSHPNHTIVARCATGPANDVLSAAEMLTVAGIAAGLPRKAIAADLGTTDGTVSRRVSGTMRKLKLVSLAELVALFGPGAAAVPLAGPRPDLPWSVWVPGGVSGSRLELPGGDCLVMKYPRPQWCMPMSLTAAEGNVARALIAGASQATAARTLGIAPRTVANHLAGIYSKLHAHSRVDMFVALRRMA